MSGPETLHRMPERLMSFDIIEPQLSDSRDVCRVSRGTRETAVPRTVEYVVDFQVRRIFNFLHA